MTRPHSLVNAQEKSDKQNEIILDKGLVEEGIQHTGTEYIPCRKR
jgi:hypothetical protein